ncbi:OmpA family protein [Nocardiopsis sp. FIRDI 009]|uniref:OmpA family protein n=1 Tax=Nocardiopsis sp. FIRDI 009 TaxID=714197 RepID=UPI000E243F80|nr:OmpA family protein [Nocardiopsis sp. FIRDI 009]
MTTRAIAAAALALLLTSCGLVDDPPGTDTAPTAQPSPRTGVDQEQRPRLPFVRQGRMSIEGGNDVTFELTITKLEHNGEYLMLEVTHDYLEDLPGTVTGRNPPVRLVDPLTGEVLRFLRDAANNDEPYGTHFVPGDPHMPTHEGLPTTLRRYLPAPTRDAEYLTLTGAGIGLIPGIPLTHVDEFTPAPEPNAHDYIDPQTFAQEPELPDRIWYPDNPPPPGLDTSGDRHTMESFVDGPTASTTRSGDQETIALHTDEMFAFDSSEPTAEAARTIRACAQTLRANVGPHVEEITVVGHTDGRGSAAYNQTLSHERARAARALLEEELGTEFTFTTQGRGSTEPLAAEGGPDDEQARARNRRVEFTYQVPPDADTQNGLASARRHVADPAHFFDDPQPVTTLIHNDVDLHVYPMVRDGAYLFQMVGFQNSTLSPLQADLDTDASVIPGSPAQHAEGTLGGFRLHNPDTGLVRYVIRIRTGDDTYEDFADRINELATGEQYLALAVFPAPALDVTEMTLHAGAFGQVEVPIR